MGNWGEESSELAESQNEISVNLCVVSSNGTHHGEDDVHVEVEVAVDGDDHRGNEVAKVEGLVQEFERVGLEGNGSEVANVEEGVNGGGGGDEYEEGNSHVYPMRPYAVDCSFYNKTGTCKFGQNCRFNHPPQRVFQPVGDKEKGMEYSNGSNVDTGKIECKYFPTPGGCKYGDACRYIHSTRKVETEAPMINFLGLPYRPSAKECTFYLRTGSCGYGANCRFHHPDPAAAKETESGNSVANDIPIRGDINFSRNHIGEPLQSFGASQGLSRSSDSINSRNGFYVPGMSSYHQTMPQNPGWNQSQVAVSLAPMKTPVPHQLVNFSKKPDPSMNYEHLMQVEEFPERPGQPDCDYFMKTGDCKYRSACRYNHPINLYSKLRLPPQSSKGHSKPATTFETSELSYSNPNSTKRIGMSSAGEFPERPGQPECEYYMKTGHCKFRSACRYHHPKNRMSTLSTSTLSEKGLPLRPGAKICRNYEQQGTCKYGRNCLFHHPDDSSPAVPLAPVAAQVKSSTNVAVAAVLESPAGNNVQSDWDDGWAM